MAVDLLGSTTDLVRKISFLARNQRVQRALAATLLSAAALSTTATYLAVTGVFGISPVGRQIVEVLYSLNIVLLLLFGAVVVPQLAFLWIDLRSGLIGARLHARLVLWFGLVALVPTLIISVLSVLYFAYGLTLNQWLGANVSATVTEAATIIQGRMNEFGSRLLSDTRSLAAQVQQEALSEQDVGDEIRDQLRDQATKLKLDEAAIVSGIGEIVISAGRLELTATNLTEIERRIEGARTAGYVVSFDPSLNLIRAIVPIGESAEMFFVAGRRVNPDFLPILEQAKNIASFYRDGQSRGADPQTRFIVIIAVLALLLLLAAIWAALIFATRLVRPISSLVEAAERIGAGKLDTRVPEAAQGDELGVLSGAFNRMTQQIETQRNELVTANRQLEERRRFTEVVLAGVSAGVIGLDENGCINLPNRSASDLLGIDLTGRMGESAASVVPEMASLVEQARLRPSWIAESQISLVRGAETRTLLVRVVAEFMATRLIGFVVTFDDVTELLSAQRKAAWADVARRIAHEIKNPLTPIQLSAERLKRKYLKEITSDRETFETCTDTIVRQVGDIGRMVDEFSSFARMPAPVMGPENVIELCREAMFLQQNAYTSITYSTEFPKHAPIVNCDGHQIGQALTNLLKNAAESIEARHAAEDDAAAPGHIHLQVRENAEDVTISVEDNGRGLPEQGRERLTEPYVTTRVRGTGLGLAIVKKIMEDHAGLLILEDRAGGGASVKLLFRRESADKGASRNAMSGGLVRAHGS